MPRRQLWMADDHEFGHLGQNSQRVLRLNDQYENHPYVEEFTKECNAMFVYGTFQGDTLPNNASNFCRQMTNCMKTWNY